MNESLYSLPEGWHWMKLADVADIVTGTTPSKAEAENYGCDVPFIKPGDLQSFEPVLDASDHLSTRGAMKARIVPAGSVMVTCIGATIGKSGITGTRLATNQQINSLVLREGCEPLFVFYYCLSDLFQELIKANASSTTLPIINKSRFSALPIAVAPVSEQQRITKKIGLLFAQSRSAREALERVPALLKQFRQAVLAAAFRGELTERDPNDEPAAVLLERIRDEQQADGKVSKIGRKDDQIAPDMRNLPKLPEGWAWAKFEELLTELKNGYFAKTPDLQPPGIPILRISAVRSRSVSFEGPRYLRVEDASRVAQYYLRNGDLLFTRYNGSLELVGVCGLVKNLNSTVIYPDKLIRARVVEKYVEPSYLELYFSTRVPRRLVEEKAKSSAGQQGISGKDLKAVPVAIAPIGEQRRLVARVEALLERADAIERALEVARRRAETVDQAILARAFRGELLSL